MRIEGLTELQFQIAETLWSIGGTEECQAWLSRLPIEIREEALVVMELMILASIDDEIENMTSYPDAEAIIAKVRKS